MTDMDRRLRAAENCQITTDGRLVWVNSAEGWCIARFTQVGMDIYEPPDEPPQQSLFFARVHTVPDDWKLFCEKLRGFYGIEIADSYMPTNA